MSRAYSAEVDRADDRAGTQSSARGPDDAGFGRSNGRLDHSLETSLDGLIVLDIDGRVQAWNESAEEMFGYSFSEARGRNVADLIVPPEHRQAHERGMRRYVEGGRTHHFSQPFEIEAMRRDGERFPVMLTLSQLTDGDAPMVLGAIRDVSRLRAAGLDRSDIERRFRVLVEQLPVVVFTDATDAHFTPLYVSPQIESLLGYTAEEWLSDPESWQKSLHPDDRESVIQQAIDVAFDHEFELEYRMIDKQGKTVWVSEKSVTIFDGNGNPKYTQGIFEDVSEKKRAERRIQETEARYRSLIEQTPAITFRLDDEEMTSVSYVSPQIRTILGFEPEEWIENPGLIRSRVHPEDLTTFNVALRASIKTGKRFNLEFRQGTAAGEYRWLSVTAQLARDEDDTPLFWQGVMTDVTERRQMENEFESLRVRYQHVAANATDAIVVIDRRARFLFANDAFLRMMGYTEEELQRVVILDLLAPQDIERATAVGLAMLRGDKPSRSRESLRYVTKDGDVVITEASMSLVYTRGRPIGFQVIIRDITERVQMEEALAHQAFHDALTGLPNRAKLVEEIASRIEDGGSRGEFALVFLDLDNFKVLNDSLGHDVGDRTLVEVGKRIRSSLRADDFVARFGGDEFVVLLKWPENGANIVSALQRLIDAFNSPFDVDGREVSITASIGVARCLDDVKRPAELLRRADLAMYESKARGRNRFAFHHNGMDQLALDRLELETDLRHALQRDELRIAYQPVWHLASKEIFGVEALVRWDHPKRGLLTPGDFIPVAEETELIVQLDRWVLREAFREVDAHLAQPLERPFVLSVNMSARQLDQDDFVAFVDGLLARHAGDGSIRLALELTETAMMRDSARAREMLTALSARGVRIALDDFGMGYSSLAQIRHIPVQCIKIDQQFTADLNGRDDGLIIVSGMIELSHALGLSVIAEGIETAEQAHLLSILGCDYAQGYFFGRPAGFAEIATALRSSASVSSSLTMP